MLEHYKIWALKGIQLTERLLACAKQSAGEDNAVEGNIVLGHELPVLNLLGILPPQLPVARVLGRDTDVPDRSIKPHIEYLKVKFRTYALMQSSYVLTYIKIRQVFLKKSTLNMVFSKYLEMRRISHLKYKQLHILREKNNNVILQ